MTVETIARNEVRDLLAMSHGHMRSDQAKNAELATDMDRLRRERAAAGEIAWALIADREYEVCQARAESFSLAAASMEVLARHLHIVLPGTPEAEAD